MQSALRSLAPAVIGMLGAAAFSLGRAAITGWLGGAIAVLSFLVLARFKSSPIWPLATGGAIFVIAAHFGLR